MATLNAIVAASSADAVVQVVVYNVVWFSVAIGALVVSAFHPTAARDQLENAEATIRPPFRSAEQVAGGFQGLPVRAS